MTDEQKKQIINLRHSGFGYVKIGQALGLSKDTVKSFCRRNNLAGELSTAASVNDDNAYCKNCGKKLQQPAGQKTIKFCSASCRQNWWNNHPEQVNRKAIYTFTCAACKKTFTAYGNSHRKYCSHACYIHDRFKGGDDI